MWRYPIDLVLFDLGPPDASGNDLATTLLGLRPARHSPEGLTTAVAVKQVGCRGWTAGAI